MLAIVSCMKGCFIFAINIDVNSAFYVGSGKYSESTRTTVLLNLPEISALRRG